jgi:hypothetical protein
MIYVAYNQKTKEEIKNECPFELENSIEEKGWNVLDVGIFKMYPCRGCQEYKGDTDRRVDYYGIFTGHYCNDCYENNYPYRKDRYPTYEIDGFGEYLGED